MQLGPVRLAEWSMRLELIVARRKHKNQTLNTYSPQDVGGKEKDINQTLLEVDLVVDVCAENIRIGFYKMAAVSIMTIDIVVYK